MVAQDQHSIFWGEQLNVEIENLFQNFKTLPRPTTSLTKNLLVPNYEDSSIRPHTFDESKQLKCTIDIKLTETNDTSMLYLSGIILVSTIPKGNILLQMIGFKLYPNRWKLSGLTVQ